MSQTAEIIPPLLSEGSPDRAVNCELALEAQFNALVADSESLGWTALETATTLLNLAQARLAEVQAIVAAAA